MTRLLVVLLPLLAAVIAKPWVPGGEPDLEGIALETGLGFNVDEPTAPHADFTRVFTLHGYPMKCGPTEKFEGGTCVPDPEAEGADYEGEASDAVEAEDSYGAPADYDSEAAASDSYGAPAEEALGEYAAEGRRGRKASKGRKVGRRTKGRKTQRRKTQGKRTQRKRTQRKGKKAQRKQRRRQ